MNIKQFGEFNEQVNFENVNGVGVGFIGNIPTTITNINGYLNVAPNLNPEVKKGIFEIVKPHFKAAKISITKAIILTLSGSYNKALEQYQISAQILEDAFRQVAAKPVDKCPICGQTGCDSAALEKTIYTPVHYKCVQEKCEKEVENVRLNAVNGNYLTGMLGGLLGAFAAVALCSLVIIGTETMYAALYMLIPFAIYYGYKLLNGRMDKLVTVYTLVLSLVAAAACNYVPVIYFLASNAGSRVPFSLVLKVAFSGEVFAEMLKDLVFSYLFIAIGIASTWGVIKKTGVSYIEDNQRILDTMKPLPNRMFDNAFNNLDR